MLIAEDNLSELRLLNIGFEESGLNKIVETVIARDGEEAIDILDRGEKFDFILLDLNMPRVPGKEVLEHVKHGADFGKPIIIILSNSVYERDVEECYALGADGYIQKAADFDELVSFCEALKSSLESHFQIREDYISKHTAYRARKL